MDYVTRQFINLTKKFRRELRLLLTALHRTLDEQTKAIHESTKAKNIAQAPQQILSTVNLPDSIEIHHSADEAREQRGYQNRTVLLSFVTFLAVAIYAFIVYFQYREMINATGAAQQAVQESRLTRQQSEKMLNATIEQFHLDQRAWIAPYGISSFSIQENTPLTFEVEITNSGKTPALEMTRDMMARSYLAGQKFLPVYEEPPANAPEEASKGVMFPGVHAKINTAPPLLIPSKGIEQLKNRTIILYVYGRINYRDVFNVKHLTTFCFVVNKSLSYASACSTYNHAD